ncbi:MAG: T9SS type A sorting domain-containing protein, partial [Bacteroidota bacterium]|nr:T9SS type A sorting domain-containing protein [Bacteroidota bacterium]
TYLWSNGATTQNIINVPTGSYSVVVTDANGCQFTSGAFVNSISSLVATATSTLSSCSPCTGTITVLESGGTAPYTYNVNGVTQTNGNFSGVCPGVHVVTVTDANGCTAIYTIIVGSSGIPGLTVSDSTNIESGFGMNDGSIFLNLSGGSTGPYTYSWSNGATTEDIYSLSAGTYTVTITDSNGDCATYTFTVGSTPGFGYVTGYLYNDVNGNCVFDGSDYPLSGYFTTVTDGTTSYYGYTNSAGYYSVWAPSGSYTVTPNSSTSLTAGCTASYSVTISGGSISSGNNFYYSYPVIHDVCVTAWSPGIVPGFTGNYYVYIINNGTVPASGSACIYLPSVLTFVSSVPAPASVSGDSICINYSGILPGGMTVFYVTFYTPPGTPLGVVLTAEVNATLTSGVDVNPACNTYFYSSLVTGSYDPNDKTPNPIGEGIAGNIPVTEDELTYLIRFQNTGTGPAVNIVVDDTLTSMLDPLSFEMLNSSHPYVVEMLPGNIIRWKFTGINLPDSTSNEPGSHGHVQFKLKTSSTPMLGQVIQNKAYIYFDFNEPVITNTAINTYAAPSSIEEGISNGAVKVYPNPFTDQTTFVIDATGSAETFSFEMMDVMGKKVIEMTGISSGSFSVSRSGMQNGIYFYKIFSAERVVGIGKVIIK